MKKLFEVYDTFKTDETEFLGIFKANSENDAKEYVLTNYNVREECIRIIETKEKYINAQIETLKEALNLLETINEV